MRLTETPVRRPVTDVHVVAYDESGARSRPDQVVTEEPMEVRVGGPGQEPEAFAVTMRTPGNDFELAAGLCHTEGLVAGFDDLDTIAYCLGGVGEQLYNVVTVRTRRRIPDDRRDRRFLSTSSCGICGKAALDEVAVRCVPVAPGPTVAASVLTTLPARLAEHQRVFGATGGLHAAAGFSADGTLHAAREDVGRHNALDKLVGHTLLESRVAAPARDRARLGPVVVRARAEGRGRGRARVVRGLGAVEPRGCDRESLRPDRRRVPARRPVQRLHAPRARGCGLVSRRPKRRELVKSRVGLHRDLWVGWKPNGVGEQKPHHYGAIARTVWDNRRELPWAWRILRKGVCDGCALGVAGFHDWTISGVHLCTTRLDLLKINTAHAIDDAVFADADTLARRNGRELRELGRLAHPMVRRRGERGFTRVTWDDALDLVAERVHATTPERVGLYLTARGITNEVYYVAQKAARCIGTNNVDNAARVCHAPSTVALKEAIGVAATTCSYRDVIESDLIVLFGADVANAQPVFMKYLYLAKQRGAKVAVVNPIREPGLERYWVPSNAESAVFGTKMTDEFFPVHTGGDVAFVNGVLKELLAIGGVDRRFVTDHTTGFDALLTELEDESFAVLEAAAGTTRADMARFARLYAAAESAVLVWSMGVTQHATGVDNVRAIVNLGLARGNVGRPGAGLMPIRGHSGVQGGAEMGCYATVFPGGEPITPAAAADLADAWGFAVPDAPGLTAAEMVEATRRGDLDVLWSSGGNFLDVLPAPDATRTALARTPTRVHQDIVLTHQMLVEPGDVVVLLPVATRYEQEGGGTSTTTERRVAFGPEIPGPRVGEARSEWRVFADVARRVHPDRAERFGCTTGDEIRAEIARVVPAYAGIEQLRAIGDSIQLGGERLCAGGVFPTADGRGRFGVVAPVPRNVPEGRFVLSTRRGKQFNSMVWNDVDPLTGAARDALFLASSDASALGVGDGDAVVVRSAFGEMRARVHIAPMRPGNVQAFFPEANPLLSPTARDRSGVPDYNAVVEVVPIA